MIGHKYSAVLLLSVLSASAALSDQPLSIKTKSVLAVNILITPQAVEQRIIADAHKHIQEVKKNHASVGKIVCSYKPDSTVDVKAYYDGYRQPSEVVKTANTTLLNAYKAAGSDVAEIRVTYVKHEDELCLTTYRSNGNRLDSKEISCNNI